MTLESDLNGKSLVGPLWAITCNDAVAHPSAPATAALARSLQARYPLGGDEAVANNLIGCPGWNGSHGAVAHLHPNRAPTPLVIGNTGDPNTPTRWPGPSPPPSAADWSPTSATGTPGS